MCDEFWLDQGSLEVQAQDEGPDLGDKMHSSLLHMLRRPGTSKVRSRVRSRVRSEVKSK